MKGRSESTERTAFPDTLAAGAPPPALPDHCAEAVARARARAEREAMTEGLPLGVAFDRFIGEILEESHPDETRSLPTAGTLAAYRRDHARLRAQGLTPLDKANTYQHFNRLRSACRFSEREAIADLRRAADAARRAKQPERMRALTAEAFERAAVFHAVFLAADRPTWATKSTALRAVGLRPKGKSKRSAGRVAPSPDDLLMALMAQPRRLTRVETLAAVFAVFGIRPKELQHGVRLENTAEGLRLHVTGAKVDAVRGQPQRVLEVSHSAAGASRLTFAVLADAASRGGGWVQASALDIVAVRRAMREVKPGLSPYAYRHARASDAKATHGRAGVAAWLGHSNDRTQQHYGHKRSGKGVVTVKSATASRAVRASKSLPPTAAQRFARAAARVAVNSGRSISPQAPPSIPRRPRPRLG